MALAQTRFAAVQGHRALLAAAGGADDLEERRPARGRGGLPHGPASSTRMSREARIAWLGFALEQDRRERIAAAADRLVGAGAHRPAYARPFAAGAGPAGPLQRGLALLRHRGPGAAPGPALARGLRRRALPRRAGRRRSPAARAGAAGRRRSGRAGAARPGRRPPAWRSSRSPSIATASSTARPRRRRWWPTPACCAHLRGDAAAAPVTETLVRSAGFDDEVQPWPSRPRSSGTTCPPRAAGCGAGRGSSRRPGRRWRCGWRMALAENDHETLAAILASEAETLPLGDRVTVLRQLGRRPPPASWWPRG